MDKKDPPEKSTTETVWDIAQKMSTSHQSTCSTKRKKPFKVLLAVDAFEYTVEAFEYWSEFAEKAFDWYLYHLHRKGAFLILTHFIDASKEKEYQKKEEEMIELQEVYENRLLQLKIDHQWITGTGSSPGEHIIKVAEEQGAEMIVMGARGLGKIKRAILGSVSDYVIRKSKIPVLICKWDK